MSTTISSVSPALLAKMNPASEKPTAPGLDTPEGIQNRFLTLLMTQLQNQDPSNPMDNDQITSQMAQLSTVSGITQMNGAMQTLLSSLQESQSMQAANLIGKSVVVPGNAIILNEGRAEFGVQLQAPAANVQATITDAFGAVINTIDLGNLPSGVSAIPWDGTAADGSVAPDGQYAFSIKVGNGKDAVQGTPLSVGLVTSVSTGASGAQLNIPSLGSISFSKVLQIL